MKAILITALLMVIATVGFSQRNIKKLDIKEEGFKIKIDYQTIVDNTESNGVKIKITPIPANELDTMFDQSSSLNGKFDYQYYEKSRDSYFLKKQKKRREKSDLEFLLEGLEWLLDNERINQNEYDVLNQMIMIDFIPDYETNYLKTDFATFSNPFFLGNTYMNVFKIEFTNTTSNLTTFDENILVKCSNNASTFLKSEFLHKEMQNLGELNLNKSLNLERYNLETPLLLPPKSTVTKYFSVLPMDANSEQLEIFLTNNSNPLSWKIIKNQVQIDKQYSFYEIVLEYWNAPNLLRGKNYNIICNSPQQMAYFANDKLYINSNDIEKNIEIFTLSLYNDQLFFYGKMSILPSSFLDLKKNKRISLKINTQLMSEVNKIENKSK